MRPVDSDVIVVGAGVAGLSFAIQMAKRKPASKIAVLSKTELKHSNSYFAQGGIATVTDSSNDSFEEHFNDTISSGGGQSCPSIVRLVVESAPDRLLELVEYGMDFTLNDKGHFDLGLEGGHSHPRVVHTLDNTGEHLINTLIRKAASFVNISFYNHRHCIEVLKTSSKKVQGVVVLNTIQREIELFTGKFVVLATGGSGQVYRNTTNPSVATGDGLAMGLKAGAEVSNLNFVQFHPTVFFEENQEQLDLLSEAIRGYGAYVVDKTENRFLFKTDTRGELATRDIVSKAIFQRLNESGDNCVYLDCRHLEPNQFKSHFPKITSRLASKDIDISTDLIPIVPAAHYQCGGLKTNEKGETNISHLCALGECAETGLHGVNRLASNSLLEGLVFAHETARFISTAIDTTSIDKVTLPTVYRVNNANDELFLEVKSKIKNTMTQKATITATVECLDIAKNEFNHFKTVIESLNLSNNVSKVSIETTNLWIVANEIIQSKLSYLNTHKVDEKQSDTYTL